MKFLKNTIGFMALFAALPAFAVTTRASVTGAVSSRLPTIAAQRASSVAYTTATASSLLDNSDCVNAYTSCIKGENACGEDFSECTNSVLFHGKMAQCLGTLTQCNSSGIQLLFGTTSINSLGAVKSYKNAPKNTEVKEYTYPASGSVLGQMIDSAYISTRLDTSKCVSRYTTCLKGATVCGADFGLCTSDTEFNKQKVFCESTLARCETAGINELFGNDTGDTISGGRIRTMITEASELAALNAVQNCYNVVDNCIYSACKRNPYKCKSGVANGIVNAAEGAAASTDGTTTVATSSNSFGTSTASDIATYIRNQCYDSITANKSCFMTFNEGNKATNKEMADTFAQEYVFNEAYNSRMSSAAMQTKINGYIEDFDKQKKSECVELIGKCAIGACGGGINAVCYDNIFGDSNTTDVNSINNSALYPEIKNVCEAVVNTSASCIYAASNLGSDIGNYSNAYVDGDAFTTLFPQYGNGGDDPLGVVAMANSTLAAAFTPAMISASQQECQTAAYDCIKKMCGTDYVNCYRNRTDIMSTLTNTENTAFDNSMNKVGGVLDYTIVLGLCVNSVKSEEKCATYLDIETARKAKASGKSNSWLDSTKYESSALRTNWLSAGNATGLEEKEYGKVQDEDEYGNQLCCVKNDANNCGTCGGYTADNRKYSEPKMVSNIVYAQKQAATGIFQDVIYDAEKEAQAIYNAKLTAEQNACLAMNKGGIVGSTNVGSTYAWVKLRNGRVPSSYANDGLSANSFVASNEIYGSFCRVRVMLTSNDKSIQEYMKNKSWTTAYFAVGDPFVCGSWIPESDLTTIAEQVAAKKLGYEDVNKAKKGELKEGQRWATAGISLLGTGLGAGITDVLQTKTGLGGLLGTASNTGKNAQYTQEQCIKEINAERKYWEEELKKMEMSSTTIVEKRYYTDAEGNQQIVETPRTYNSLNGYTMMVSGYIYGPASSSGRNTSNYVERKILVKSDGGSVSQADINDHLNNLNKAEVGVCNKNAGVNGSGRAGADVVGGLLVGGLAGVTSWQAMKASNRAKFTEAQQEFMDEVGSKINCVIGNDGYDSAQQLGSYGDLMMSELDTAASDSSATTVTGATSAMVR